MDGVKNYKVSVKELQGSIIFLRKIMRGGANKSFGIEVAELAGVDKAVTERAKVILRKIEKSDFTVAQEDDSFSKTGLAGSADAVKSSEVERIVKDVDLNNLSPMQAFNILVDLQEKVKGGI